MGLKNYKIPKGKYCAVETYQDIVCDFLGVRGEDYESYCKIMNKRLKMKETKYGINAIKIQTCLSVTR